MPRPALTDEQRRKTRHTIRRAAAALYANNGLADITARKVADAAGVSVGTLYSYFENLTELMQSLWKAPVRALIQDFEREVAEHRDPLAQLRALLTLYAQFAQDNPAVYRGAFLFVRATAQPQPDRVTLRDDRLFAALRDCVMRAQANEQLRQGNPDALTQLLWSGLHGAIALPQNIDRLTLAPAEQITQAMIDTLLAGLAR